METTVTELGDSKVKIDVAVDADSLQKRLDRAARTLAGEMKVPGFRKGKVPPQLVIQRVGREAVLEEALRASLPEWYERALTESGVNPVGDPKLDVGDLPAEGEDLRFSIEVGVRPKAELGEYTGLEVGRVELEVPDEAVQSELDRLREGFASLAPVERAAAPGDSLLIDFAGAIDGEPFDGSESKDFLIELGAEGLLPEFDAALVGASAGDQRTVDVTFPDDHRPEELAGKTATFEVTAKEVREKDLPELDDDFAAEASEFETLDELRDHIRSQISEAFERRAEAEFREAAVEAAAQNATVELPDELVHARAHEMWDRIERQLAARGIDPAAYARMQGKDRHDLINDAEDDAAKALRREAVLEAVADAEGIEPTDEDLLEALGPGEGDNDPQRLLDRLREAGRDGLLREEVRMRRAVDVIADSAKPIPLEQAEARERIWTPDKDAEGDEGSASKQPDAGELWTPGS
jgi:trigger factor